MLVQLAVLLISMDIRFVEVEFLILSKKTMANTMIIVKYFGLLVLVFLYEKMFLEN